MKRTIEEMKAEAIERMKELKLTLACINAFKNHDEVWMSEGPYGSTYETRNETELLEKLKEFNDEEHLAYHVIHTPFEFGECYSIFYVYADDEEWKYDREDLKDGIQLVYVWNKDDEWCSEYGSIGFRRVFGGLVRTE